MLGQKPKPTMKFYSDAGATNEITTAQVSATNGTVYVKVTSGYNPNCFDILPVTFVPTQAPPFLKDVVTISLTCDNNNDGEEPFDLTTLESQFLDNSSGVYKFSY